MAMVLVITCSPRSERSVSTGLTTHFAQQWARHHPQDTIRLRDLGHHPVPHVTESWIVGASAGADSQTAASRDAIEISDRLIDEFLSADRYVIGVTNVRFVTAEGMNQGPDSAAKARARAERALDDLAITW